MLSCQVKLKNIIWITPFNLKSTVKEREKRVTYAMPTPSLFNLKSTVKAVNLLQRMTKIPVWIQLLVCVWIAFLVLHLCVYVFLYLFIYLLRSVFYVRFYLSVGLVHGTHYLFDSKIFTKMCLLVGPQRMRFASFFYFWCCVCAFTFSLFKKFFFI